MPSNKHRMQSFLRDEPVILAGAIRREARVGAVAYVNSLQRRRQDALDRQVTLEHFLLDGRKIAGQVALASSSALLGLFLQGSDDLASEDQSG